MDSKSILLVEDNPDDEALTLRALRKANIVNEVVVAHDGQEAIDLLLTFDDPSATPTQLPSLVLLDLKLPKLDGFEVLNRLRNHPRTSLVPVVVLTSSSEDEDIVKSYQSGANSYVRKPVSFTAFVEAVGQLGCYWLLLNESTSARHQPASE